MKEPTTDWQGFVKDLELLKDEVQDMDCGGETIEFLSEWSSETGIAQHSVWSGCQKIITICHRLNDRLNMNYPHPLDGDL